MLSHFWEMDYVERGLNPNHHGIQVGVATPVIARFFEEVEDMAKAYSMEVEKVKEYLSDNDKESIMEDLKVKKAVALVKDSAVATLEPKSDEE